MRSFRPFAASALDMCLSVSVAFAQPSDSASVTRYAGIVPTIRAARLAGSIRIDGRLDEAGWGAATPATEFTQLDPDEGKPASERSEVRILIGDDALYIGARLYDSEPGKIKGLLARRDVGTSSDLFEVFIDSYHDHLTASRFR